MRLLDHIESFLGPTEGGWKDPSGEEWPFHVLEFPGGPIPETRTFCTFGLSEFPLKQPDHSDIRLELMLVSLASDGPMSIPALLHDLAIAAMKEAHAYIRGDVIGPGRPLFPEAKVEFIYVTTPMHLPTEFYDVRTIDNERCFIEWMVPITREETDFIDANGWDSFEDAIVKYQPNVFDLFRDTFIQQ